MMEESTATQAKGFLTLTQEQVDSFWADGFLRVGKVLTDEEIEFLRAEYDREFELARAGKTTFRNLATKSNGSDADNKKEMLQIMQMCERNIHFRSLVYHAGIADVIEDLVGPNIQLFHDQALYKPPFHGGPVHWHQDNAYWQCTPANLISAWLTLDDVDEHNGAMQFIPQSHLRPVGHDHSNVSDALLDSGRYADESKRVIVDLPAGGIAIHHCQTLHQTAPNTTERQRRAFAIHYMVPGTRSRRTGEYLSVSFGRPLVRARI